MKTVSIVLACIGLFGVVSFSVAQRTREVGIRLSMGAQSQGIVGMLIGAIITVVIFQIRSEPQHGGVNEIRFKGNENVNLFTVYKDRLHLMVPLPVTGESNKIVDEIKEEGNAKDKRTDLPRVAHPKNH